MFYRDFRGLRKDAPLLIWFLRPDTANNPDQRTDQIMFFADGDFSSLQWYRSSQNAYAKLDEVIDTTDDNLVRGNLARVHYANVHDLQGQLLSGYEPHELVLGRRCHIMSADSDLVAASAVIFLFSMMSLPPEVIDAIVRALGP